VLVIQIAGGLIIGLVVAQLGLLFLSSFRRFAFEKQQQHLTLEHLRQQVAAATAQRQEKEQERPVWEGYRKFVVDRRVEECPGVASFYLVPHDKRPLPSFQPGQYLTFQLKIPGQAKPVIRCYSLSDSSQAAYYRVTIKKIPPPPDKPESPAGLVSSFFHEHLQEGDILDVKAPRGQFFLDLSRSTPVVLIAGGIGLTPLLCMANALAARASLRETWLFYGVRNRREHIMAEHLLRLAQERETFHLRICYSNPAADDIPDRDYQFGQRISLELLKRELPSNNYEFYLCGPPGMMAALSTDLKSWGVPATAIFSEAFGPASLPRPAGPAANAPATPAIAAAAPEVVFAKSAKTLAWDAQAQNLLNLARAHAIDIPSGCCAGNCGTCETAVKSGEVRYLRECGWQAQAGTCLVCVAEPAGDIVLDA
jgi:ferredoxin-NADP reductase